MPPTMKVRLGALGRKSQAFGRLVRECAGFSAFGRVLSTKGSFQVVSTVLTVNSLDAAELRVPVLNRRAPALVRDYSKRSTCHENRPPAGAVSEKANTVAWKNLTDCPGPYIFIELK